MKVEKLRAVTITPIATAANPHCPNLNTNPLTEPGLPINSFILSLGLLLQAKWPELEMKAVPMISVFQSIIFKESHNGEI